MSDPGFDDTANFVGHTKISIDVIAADRCTARINIDDTHHQPYGVVHGGVYCTLAETVASTGAAFWAIEQGMAGAVGVTNKTDFLRPTTGGVLLADARPIHQGRSQQLWQIDMTSEETGKLVAQSQVRLHNVTDTTFD